MLDKFVILGGGVTAQTSKSQITNTKRRREQGRSSLYKPAILFARTKATFAGVARVVLTSLEPWTFLSLGRPPFPSLLSALIPSAGLLLLVT